ncbi:hypothetical protein SPRG_15099 [Saprolegnia parasitica CBS 223.65]|uniref:CID domain-containing protein n=1 Tax=Saprolegnia parasitica (strain CBS 223.65) TaxID=695850 RepID=A0A067BSH3_SAPPC|nr:hypothetical protein SPRG_15099 [Saprolegnia parasitica CBS 223.65]KDO19765.1 hypothetical protein SPRG_15099 [Saprolegnia parasitica CBS 223.65]|eukprot:XP_012209527.1 hypothetical protein SPRG_15099 [Saprolegnia parasitica CBS 223.65]
MPSAFSIDKFTDKLRSCNETAGSIQSLSAWVLHHRAALPEMLDAWYNSFIAESTAKKIVHLYVANDVMQTGLRKIGEKIPLACAHKVMMAVVHAMHPQRDQAVHGVVRKLVRVWTDRRILNAAVLAKMADLCSNGARPIDASSDDAPATDESNNARESFQDEALLTENLVLGDLPDADDSDVTKDAATKLQDLEAEVISTDLLSDRMFQLHSNIKMFYKAQTDEAYDVDEDTLCGMNWDMLEVPVFEIVVDQSQQQVATFRHHLEQQVAKRNDLMDHYASLTTFDVLDDPTICDVSMRMEKELEDLERLHTLCKEAVVLQETTKLQKMAASKLTRRHSDRTVVAAATLTHRHSDTDVLSRSRWDRAPPSLPPPTSSSYSYGAEAPAAPTYQAPPAYEYTSSSSYAPPTASYDYAPPETYQYSAAPEPHYGYARSSEPKYGRKRDRSRSPPRRSQERPRNHSSSSSKFSSHQGSGYKHSQRSRSRSRSRERW